MSHRTAANRPAECRDRCLMGSPALRVPSAQGRTSVELNSRFTRKYTAPGLPGWGRSAEKVTGLNAPRPMPGGALMRRLQLLRRNPKVRGSCRRPRRLDQVAGLARGGTATDGHTPTFAIQALGIRWADYQPVGVNSVEAGSGRAGAIGGAREGRPRHCKMAKVASSGWIAARIRIRPPPSGHSRTSTRRHGVTQVLWCGRLRSRGVLRRGERPVTLRCHRS